MPISSLKDKTLRELKKMGILLKFTSADVLSKVLTRTHLTKITKYNVHDLYKYTISANDFLVGSVNVSWGPGNNGTPEANMRNHATKHSVELEYILGLNGYNQYGVGLFYYMRDVLVHTNGRGTYISGFFNNVFIVGRYNGNVFGISSCYHVNTGIKEGRLKDKCFDLW